jgi:hypothetical protein
MRLPYEYWLKYMLLHPKVADDSISGVVELYGLATPDEDYMDELGEGVSANKPKPFKLKNKKVKAWIRRQRVYSLVYESPDAVAARSLFDNHRLVRTLQHLIIADTPRNKIPDYCESIVGTRPTVAVVKLFEHYFWNRELLTYHEWKAYLGKYYEYVGPKRKRVTRWYHEDGDVLFQCYERGAEYALWKLGYREEIPTDVLIRGVLHEATMRFFETGGMRNDRNTAMTAKMWSETIFKAVEELSKTGDAVQHVLDQLKAVAIKLEKTDIKDIEDVTGGEYSTNPKKQA